MAIENPKYGKGIALAASFDPGIKAPLDSRLTVATIEERDAHVEGNRVYDGMLVYVEANKITYQYVITDNVGEWKEFGFNLADFIAQLANDLVTDDEAKALSAAQGVVLKGLIDSEAEAAREAEAGLQTSVDGLLEYIGTIPEDANVSDVIAYVNKKAQEVLDAATGGSSESAASVKLQLDNYISENNTRVVAAEKAIEEAKAAADAAMEHSEGVAGDLAEAIEALEGADEAQVARIATLEETIVGLSGAMHFEGVKDEVPSDVSGYEQGDVIIVGNKEYVLNGSAFVEFGDASVNAEAITALTGRMDTAEGEIDQLQTDIGTVEEALANKAEQSALDAEAEAREAADALKADKTALEAAEAEIAKKAAQSDLESEIANREAADEQCLEDAKAHTAEEIAKEVAARNQAIADAKAAAIEEAGTNADTKDAAILQEAKEYADSKVDSVDLTGIAKNAEDIVALQETMELKADASTVNGQIEALEDEVAKIGTVADGKTVVELLNEARAALDAADVQVAQNANAYTDQEVAKVNATIGEVEPEKTIIQLIAEARESAIENATYNDEAVKADIVKNTEAIEKNAEDIADLVELHNTDKEALSAKDTEIAGSVSGLQERIVALESVQHQEIEVSEINALFPEQA